MVWLISHYLCGRFIFILQDIKIGCTLVYFFNKQIPPFMVTMSLPHNNLSVLFATIEGILSILTMWLNWLCPLVFNFFRHFRRGFFFLNLWCTVLHVCPCFALNMLECWMLNAECWLLCGSKDTPLIAKEGRTFFALRPRKGIARDSFPIMSLVNLGYTMHAASQWPTALHLSPPRTFPDLLVYYMLHAANSKKDSLIWGKELTALRFFGERNPLSILVTFGQNRRFYSRPSLAIRGSNV